MQETLLKLYRTGETFADRTTSATGLIRVAATSARSCCAPPGAGGPIPWRRRRRRRCGDSPAQSELFQQVMALPTKYRAAIYLYYYEGYAVREIAALMGAIPPQCRPGSCGPGGS